MNSELGDANPARQPKSPLDGSLVLVTGASGFIGRHLCRALLSSGCRLRACARTAPKPLSDLVDWRIVDVEKETTWAALDRVDYVVHLAGLAHQLGTACKARAEDYESVNTEATRRLAAAAARSSHLKRFLFLSSVAAVASGSRSTIDDSTPCHPTSDYGRSKLNAEYALEEAFSGGRADWCILRPPLVYGSGNPGNMARLLGLIEPGFPLPLAGIRNRRSFLYVGNLIDAIERCLVHPGAGCRAFLVADSEVLSTPQLIRMIGDCMGKRVRLFSTPIAALRAAGWLGDLLTRISGRSLGVDSYSVDRLAGSLALDCSKLRDIGWTPPHSVADGLAKTLSPAATPGD